MKIITSEDFEKRADEKFEELSKGEKMWADKSKLLLEATIEIFTEKINEIAEDINFLQKKYFADLQKIRSTKNGRR